MCLAVIASGCHPEFPLILIHNRDEYHSRPTQSMQWHEQQKYLWGTDLKDKGTWLGINRRGLFAFVTNYRDPALTKPSRISRGGIVPAILRPDTFHLHTIRNLLVEFSSQMNPFNVIFGNSISVYYFNSLSKNLIRLPAGYYGLSNSRLNTPWPKVSGSMNQIRSLCLKVQVNHETLTKSFQSLAPPDVSSLPDTGISKELELMLSSVFIKNPAYGTRSTTSVLWNRLGSISCEELTWTSEGSLAAQTRFRF